MNEYYDIKVNSIHNGCEVFIMFKNKELYKMMKTNEWKLHNDTNSNFKGYNDSHLAMKFVEFGDNETIKNFAKRLNKMLVAQITIFNFSNISYDDYTKMEEQNKRDKFNVFMSALRGDYK